MLATRTRATIAELIKSLRQNNGMTQTELAKRAGVSKGAISRWEAGQRTPPTDMFITIMECLGASVDVTIREP